MIKSYAYDVEILPNFFSVSIVDVNDYLTIFKDCVNKKGNPIPLVQKYTIDEIKDKLNKVKKKSFYITDTDDTQLFEMIGYINKLQPHYENKTAIRSDLFGYNSNAYDRLMIAGLLMFVNQYDTTKELIKELYNLSKKIIELQNNKELNRRDYLLTTLRNYVLPFVNIDIMTIFALNKVGKGKDKDGNTIYFPKSLKQTSINLQWYELLDYELPPISDKDIYLYYKNDKYKDLSAEELNNLINRWDRYIIYDWIEDTIYYNLNDVFIVCEMIRLYIDEIRLRYNISKSYGIDVLSSSRSNIADKLFVKFYSEFSGLHESQWRGKKTERTKLSFKKVIFPFIKFQTEELRNMLEYMKKIVIYSIGKEAFNYEVKLNNLTYTIATGGLHSQDIPRELKSRLVTNSLSTGEDIWSSITDDSYIYVHFDIASFYPSMMDEYRIAPAHINEGVFVKLIHWLKETRVAAKHSKEALIDGIPKDILAQVLKIVINSIYGKLGFEQGDICDRLAVLKVTINGQLMIMMLCERLELAGIEVMSANTDGIVVKLYKHKKKEFDDITMSWMKETRLSADSEEYKAYINRDINNYVIQELNGKVSYKGALHPLMYAVDLQKGYDMPIVAQAVVNYFLDDKPILDTLKEATNILDFCKSQNVNERKFKTRFLSYKGSEDLQKNNRYYVSNNGGSIMKVALDGKESNLCAGYNVTILNSLDDKPIELRDINYGYYYKECLKIINPIKLNISPNKKGDRDKRLLSGKANIKKIGLQYNTLFEDNDNN